MTTDVRRHRRVRWSAAIVLLVIAALLVPVTLMARYARGELLNTDRYVATVAPLASDPAVQTALTDRVTDEVISKIDVPALIQQATNAINIGAAPAIGNLIAGPVEDWLTSFIHKHVAAFVASPTFATLWTEVNRIAHRNVSAVLTGAQGTALGTKGDSLVLNIGPIVDAAKTALVSDGFTLASKIPSVNIQFTLLQDDQLPKIQRYVRLLNTLANWLPWITLLLLAVAVWLAPNRRRATMTGVITAAVLVVLVLIAIRLVRNAYTTQLKANGRNVTAGLTIFDQMLHYLTQAAWTALVAFIVVAIWAWLAGPGRVGTAVRRGTGRGFQWIATEVGWQRSGFLAAVERYRLWIYLVLGVLGAIILLNSPTVATVAWMLVVALLITAVVAVIHRLRRPGIEVAA